MEYLPSDEVTVTPDPELDAVAAEATPTVMAALWSVLVTDSHPQAHDTARTSWAFQQGG